MNFRNALSSLSPLRPQAFLVRGACLVLILGGCASAPTGDQGASVPHIVLFGSMRSGDGDLYGVDPAGGEVRRLYGTQAAEGTVRFDPARSRIIHHEYRSEGAMLMVGERDLFQDPNGDVAPQWSPDGEWLVYGQKAGGRENLWLARADGSQPERLTDGSWIDRYPAWSPDSQRIVFSRLLPEGWDLHALDLGSQQVERLTRDSRYVGHPTWSPDGARIAFDTILDQGADIAVLELETGRIQPVVVRPGNDLIPAWSPDGTALAFGGEPEGSANWDIWLVELGSGEIRRLTRHPAGDGGPVFVPMSVVEWAPEG